MNNQIDNHSETLENVEINIHHQLAEITSLLNKLNINRVYTTNNQLENEEVIFGWGSDPEEVHVEQEEEKPESSKTREQITGDKRKLEDTHNYQWKSETQPDFMSKQGYYYKGNKYRKYPTQYKPKFTSLGPEGILNIDCVTNKEEIILEWSNRIQLLLQVEKPFGETLDKNTIWNFTSYKTTGIVQQFLQENEQALKNTPHYQTTSNNLDTFYIIAGEIYKEFLGKDIILHEEETMKANRMKALRHLNNMRICDICYLDQFICEFQTSYYKLSRTEQETYLSIFIQKLPYPLNIKVQERFQERLEKKNIAHNLGGIILITQELLAELCLASQLKRTIKHKSLQPCCLPNLDLPQQYGCERQYKSKRKHYRKRKINRYKPPKYRYRWKKYPPRYFKRKPIRAFRKPNQKYFRKNKYRQYKPKLNSLEHTQKYCPQKKKDCRCWLCHEVGHYANTCPQKNKEQYRNDIHILASAQQNNLEPIESDYNTDSSISSIYYYTSDNGGYSESESESTAKSQLNIYSSSNSE